MLTRAELFEGADLDGAEMGGGALGGDTDGVVEIVGFDQVIAGDLLAGFDVRTIGDGHLPGAHTDDCSARRWLESGGVEEIAVTLQLFEVELHALHDLAKLHIRVGVELFLVLECDAEVFHDGVL